MQDRKPKTSETNPFGLRMAPDLRRAAQAKADELERSLNWTINHLLKQALGLKGQPKRQLHQPTPRSAQIAASTNQEPTP
ncbi:MULTISPECIES: hypothetical protein [unclassified Xanthomonas]|uniref:hypothetical protein n=1 Tax=unclassified Xanthomonas TaxID=2643310 RepID=UPI002A803792|nr:MULTISPECIES: hypothetical protein [unclassified Xanthomonas]MDY4297543.1 hypothetical protein [Xanthomonas sp. LF02-5]MDY4359337.1 hypothetical protein [Xanthomonas sp. LF04-12]